MELTKKEIAEAFSLGNFSRAFQYLADDIKWNLVGDKILLGKKEVVEFCEKTAQYFKTVKTEFGKSNMIIDTDQAAVSGTARFTNKENKVTEISSCDIYIFNEEKLQEITSYCIVTSEKK